MVCLTVMGSASAFVGGGPALLRAGQVRVSCVQGRPANAVAMQAQGEDEATSGKSQLEVLEGYGYNVIDVIGVSASLPPYPFFMGLVHAHKIPHTIPRNHQI